MEKIIINIFGKQCATMLNPIIIETKDYASFNDAMKVAKFKASKFDKRKYQTLITSI